MKSRELLVLGAMTLGLLTACGDDDDAEPTPEPEPTTDAQRNAAVAAISAPTDIDMAKARLGRRLFHDTALSGDQTVSCATCHSLDHGGAEDRPTSQGIRSQVGPINAPTVLNSRFNFRQFWDGRAADLVEQAQGPVTNPVEMGATWEQVVERVQADPVYVEAFAASYGGTVSRENIADAIAEYERMLVTPSRFDRYLGGDEDAITEAELEGWRLFFDTGCTTCHVGENFGGDRYQQMGVVENYFELRGGELTEADNGRFNVTGEESDRHKFKVPTLRNITQTGPYFHDGSQTELGGAVRIMARVQLGQIHYR